VNHGVSSQPRSRATGGGTSGPQEASTCLVASDRGEADGGRLGPPRFLVIEDNPGVARALAIWIRPYGDVVAVGTVREGLRVLDQGAEPWSGFIVDVGLPDGLGIDVLRRARTRYPGTPALVLTGSIEPTHINAACSLGALYMIKGEITLQPACEFLRFVLSALPLSGRLQHAARRWGTGYGLTMAELDVLVGAALGESRETVAERRGSALGTVKTQIASLLRKTGDSSLHEAATRLLHEVQL
jgi:DNA-binding NarL/FixJ family response regulator